MPEWNPRANEIFLQAVEIVSPSERAAFLERRCDGDAALRAEVESLLATSVTLGSFLESPVLAVPSEVRVAVHAGGLSRTTDSSPAPEKPGTLVGRYKLRELIGEGGMGTVWVAEQTEPVRRKVALKLVKPGMDTKEVLSRFEVERQALALMDHPNIAKVHDGGVTASGRPFFVMEYVKGIPITQYCDEAKLTVQDRLALFVQVCQAVQHAHQKGIIHRDLKPSNILVCIYDGRPIPKIIDFGLAKAMHQPLTENTLYTAHGMMVGTPLYMSPEQAEFNNLDVDTRTDIYSLGVVLYELLTGTTPLERKRFKEAALQEVLRIIKEEDPQKPSTKISGSGALPAIAAQRGLEPAQLSRVVQGDLDWIAMKALEKDRSRRYESASGLARDVQRYLEDEPVEACPPSLAYKLRKLARRNQKAIATFAFLSLVVCVALAVIAGSVGWAVRDRQNRQAVVERRIEAALEEVDAALREGRWNDAEAALQQAEGLQAGTDVRPAVRDRVRACQDEEKLARRLREIPLDRSGRATDTVGRAAIAQAYRRAFDEHGIALDKLGPETAALRIRESVLRAHLLAALDAWTLALPAQATGSAGKRVIGRADLLAIARLADDDPWRRELREALHSRDLKRLQGLAESSDWTRLPPLNVVLLAEALDEAGKLDAAETLLDQAIGQFESDFSVNQALGFLLARRDSAQALRYLQLCKAQRPENWAVRSSLGWAYYLADDCSEAEKELREAIRLRPDDAVAHTHLGITLEYVSRTPEALDEFQRAMRLDPVADEPCRLLTIQLMEARQFAEAEKVLRKAVEDNPQAAPAHRYLGEVLAAQNKLSEAEQALDKAVRLAPNYVEEIQTLRARLRSPETVTATIENHLQHYLAVARHNPDDHASQLRLAVLQLYVGNRAEYETLCRQMLDRFGDSEVAIAVHRVSFACLLVSPPVGELDRQEQLAQRASANGGSGLHAALLYGRGRGLAAYRAGRWEEAIQWCASSRFAGQELTVSEAVPPQNMVIEAMAHHQLGRTATAHRLYHSAARVMAKWFPAAPAELGMRWFDWVVYEILRREAAALLEIDSAEAPPAESVTRSAEQLVAALTLLNQGEWDKGAGPLVEVVEDMPHDHLLAMQAAVLQCYRGDRTGYERICTFLLKHYGDTEDPLAADRTAKACLLADPPVGDLAPLQRLAEVAVSEPEHGFYRFFALVRALSAYRAGNGEETLAWCRAGQARLGNPKEVPYLAAHYLVVQALAMQQLKQREQALVSLAEAAQIMNEAYPDAPADLGGRWPDWMLYEVLREEAETLLGSE
jgi:serine/threonine protein kinase/Flp pilus assembly protein TadD